MHGQHARASRVLSPGKHLTIKINHVNGNSIEIEANHTYNAKQIEWFKAGSALNLIKKQNS